MHFALSPQKTCLGSVIKSEIQFKTAGSNLSSTEVSLIKAVYFSFFFLFTTDFPTNAV